MDMKTFSGAGRESAVWDTTEIVVIFLTPSQTSNVGDRHVTISVRFFGWRVSLVPYFIHESRIFKNGVKQNKAKCRTSVAMDHPPKFLTLAKPRRGSATTRRKTTHQTPMPSITMVAHRKPCFTTASARPYYHVPTSFNPVGVTFSRAFSLSSALVLWKRKVLFADPPPLAMNWKEYLAKRAARQPRVDTDVTFRSISAAPGIVV